MVDVNGVLKALSRLCKTLDVGLLVVSSSYVGHYYKLLLTRAKHYRVERCIYTYPPQPYEKMPYSLISDFILAPYVKTLKNYTTSSQNS